MSYGASILVTKRDNRATGCRFPEMIDHGRQIIWPDQSVGIQGNEKRVGIFICKAGQRKVEPDLAGKPDTPSLGRQFHTGGCGINPRQAQWRQGSHIFPEKPQGEVVVVFIGRGGICAMVYDYQDQEAGKKIRGVPCQGPQRGRQAAALRERGNDYGAETMAGFRTAYAERTGVPP